VSFEEQERALFDLLFDRSLREHFCKDPSSTLQQYDLDTAERIDFDEIRPDALELDAAMRADLVLSHLCRAFPLSFSIVSSLSSGLEILKEFIDTETMRSPPVERATAFGVRLRDRFVSLTFNSTGEQAIANAILEAELGMAWTSATLKRVLLDSGPQQANQSVLTEDWSGRPIKLAAYVCAAIIPQPYQQLRQALCPCADTELWAHLSRNPLTASRRKDILQRQDPRLILARASVSHMSYCEPTVDQKTVELIEGFAPLFQHINGTASVDEILAQFKRAGASDQILQSARAVFKQLLETGMLELVSTT